MLWLSFLCRLICRCNAHTGYVYAVLALFTGLRMRLVLYRALYSLHVRMWCIHLHTIVYIITISYFLWLATGVFFMYDLSPMMVQLTEHRRSFTHFLTGVCAIVGGVFTVAGMLDGMIYHSARALQKKIDLGKAS